MKNRLVLAGAAVAASVGLCVVASPAIAQPSDTTITCGDVAGLIAAIGAANANVEGGTITLAENCAYRFEEAYTRTGNALPAITGHVTLTGKNSTLIRSVVESLPLFRILAVSDGGSLTLDGITVTGGRIDGNGAGITNAGTLRLEHSKVAGNQASGVGGGISNEGGDVTLINSDVLTNVVTATGNDSGDGGGISNDAEGTLRVKKSTVAGNAADQDGGGIQNLGTVTIEHSHLANNDAREGNGGGLNNLGRATVTYSKIIENWAGLEGGGINNGVDATLDIQESSLDGNKSGRDGGAINNEGTATLSKSKVLENSAGRDGGGINNEQVDGADAARLTLAHTTVSDNRAARNGGGINNWPGGVVTLTDSKIIKNLPTNCYGTVPGCS
ncbi:hypothetical protein MTF65_08975 [Streptomyces sp. APSN-46.1]|uniref:hypothetical protein n=1 Tax=Streptomyces sp. APSN-46.1 TaxID=2929049 RepID=UPI001FB2523A|nr:hypothetical protein [Streptomyces sp. APSN-46.1]MCJ1677466.1 hypothetical protein [Streptomyces sp. APSN-46.1]